MAVDDLSIHPDWDAPLFRTAQWVVIQPDDVKHVFYFLPDGTVATVSKSDSRTTKRLFAYANGQWMEENLDG